MCCGHAVNTPSVINYSPVACVCRSSVGANAFATRLAGLETAQERVVQYANNYCSHLAALIFRTKGIRSFSRTNAPCVAAVFCF